MLRSSWTEALEAGLAPIVCLPLTRDGVLVPYFGDLLQQRRVDGTERGLRRLRYFQRQIASAVEERLGSRAYAVQPALAALPARERWLALLDLVPGFSRGFLRLAFRDVHDYLDNRDGLREAVIGRVRPSIEAAQSSERVVVVAHSLGSIVAYDVLNTTGARADLFVTLGSPLGIDRGVRRRLLKDERGRRSVPRGVRRWVNVADERDIVALDPRLADDFGKRGGGSIEDVRVRNPGRSPHSATAYLRQDAVCRALATCVCT